MEWRLEDDPEKPPDFKSVLLTIHGLDEAVIGARFKNEWFLINNLEQKFKGDSGKFKVIAWRFLPETYQN